MTQIFSVFRFRRWTQEKKTNAFRAGFQLMFGVFVIMAITMTWIVTEKSLTAGIVAGSVALLLTIAFDMLMRAAFFLSESHRNGNIAKRDAIDSANAATNYAKQRVNEVESDLRYMTRKVQLFEGGFETLETLINKKRRGKKLRLPKDIKNCLAAIKSDL